MAEQFPTELERRITLLREVERLKAELDKAQTQRDAMFHEIETLRGKTGYCIECVRLQERNDRLRRAGDALAESTERLARHIDEVPTKLAHEAFCNGVHAPNGMCEGEHWLGGTMQGAEDSLAAWREAAK